jgi:ElaA protein
VTPGFGLKGWVLRTYADLSRDELYAILALRQNVFVVEQHCAFLDADGLDPHAWHLLGKGTDDALAAYLRIISPGRRFAEPSIGRVAVAATYRGRGLGKELMREGVRHCRDLFPGTSIRISAQQYLERFYTELGFILEGRPFDEDGIPHVYMVHR